MTCRAAVQMTCLLWLPCCGDSTISPILTDINITFMTLVFGGLINNNQWCLWRLLSALMSLLLLEGSFSAEALTLLSLTPGSCCLMQSQISLSPPATATFSFTYSAAGYANIGAADSNITLRHVGLFNVYKHTQSCNRFYWTSTCGTWTWSWIVLVQIPLVYDLVAFHAGRKAPQKTKAPRSRRWAGPTPVCNQLFLAVSHPNASITFWGMLFTNKSTNKNIRSLLGGGIGDQNSRYKLFLWSANVFLDCAAPEGVYLCFWPLSCVLWH